MNTTKKGDELENKVYELFRDNIQNELFYARSECCKIYQQKKYYSHLRKKNIKFDIAIEIFLPGETKFTSLVLIECKNYSNKKVPAKDVEYFLGQAHQVSGGNVKAIVVSNNAFQEGAFNFAESTGIGLLRYYDRSNLEWVLHRSPSSIVSTSFAVNGWVDAYEGLHKGEYQSKYFDFFGCVNHQYTASLRLFIGSLVKHGQDNEYVEAIGSVETIQKSDNCVVKYLEESEIEQACQELLFEIEYDFGKVSLNTICTLLKEKHGMVVDETTDLPEGVLGKMSFDPLEIKILKDQENESRKRFTLAHELGHFLLGHSKYMSGEKCLEPSLDIEQQDNIGLKDVMRMEWQANQFASHLLLPTNDFIQKFKSIAAQNGISNRGFGVLYLDHQQCNQDAYYKISAPLMEHYKVSRKAIKIRLKKLGFINEPKNERVDSRFTPFFSRISK
jgi:Zn-dependent peptidase ImmA (M78 family)